MSSNMTIKYFSAGSRLIGTLAARVNQEGASDHKVWAGGLHQTAVNGDSQMDGVEQQAKSSDGDSWDNS